MDDKQQFIDYVLTFGYGGMLPSELSHLYDYCIDKTVLELGSMVGMSSYLIASVASQVYCVDVWSDTQEHLQHDKSQANIYAQYVPEIPSMLNSFCKNCGKFIDSGKIIMKRGLTSSFADNFIDQSFDVILIDADHSYQGVQNDFELYHKKVKSNGYIIFHDYGDSMWTGIKQFCDSESRLQLVSKVDRLAVFSCSS